MSKLYSTTVKGRVIEYDTDDELKSKLDAISEQDRLAYSKAMNLKTIAESKNGSKVNNEKSTETKDVDVVSESNENKDEDKTNVESSNESKADEKSEVVDSKVDTKVEKNQHKKK